VLAGSGNLQCSKAVLRQANIDRVLAAVTAVCCNNNHIICRQGQIRSLELTSVNMSQQFLRNIKEQSRKMRNQRERTMAK
jgi:hypothetical protein